jgi:hypothetical protein
LWYDWNNEDDDGGMMKMVSDISVAINGGRGVDDRDD